MAGGPREARSKGEGRGGVCSVVADALLVVHGSFHHGRYRAQFCKPDALLLRSRRNVAQRVLAAPWTARPPDILHNAAAIPPLAVLCRAARWTMMCAQGTLESAWQDCYDKARSDVPAAVFALNFDAPLAFNTTVAACLIVGLRKHLNVAAEVEGECERSASGISVHIPPNTQSTQHIVGPHTRMRIGRQNPRAREGDDAPECGQEGVIGRAERPTTYRRRH